ncbi:hypothetical protein SDRG_13243 [Saprolegnia diclina VS20]|uniref:Uncharacterized protein n=1 Tax=Saprolegnia diclina (strain VS20) TaxID=1156394 RepID=T0RAA1_SAPDV|nr:hypothetical protein SDRG_13243 [Saprolegnia diclina VS20]EQC29083.1 hypothetical protein SDRG_13243 [Saprolegnia diclina VS20]|eukprot:XP_008617542.1 hypothetical protein SDRG_13243 [Saprolegnia diclina VS20]
MERFETAYGTTFQCTSVCHFITIAFSVLLLLFVLLLLLVPVSTTQYVKAPATKRKRPPKPLAPATTVPTLAAVGVHQHLLDPYAPVSTALTTEVDDVPRIDTDDYDFIASLSTAVPAKAPPSPRRHSAAADVHVKRVNVARKKDRRAELRAADVSYETLGDDAIREHEYLEFVRSLLDGVGLFKLKSNGKKSPRIFALSHDLTLLTWTKPHGLLRKTSSVAMRDVVGVTTGVGPTGAFLSLLQADNSTLDVQADSDMTLQKLRNGFSMLLQAQQ